MEQTNVIGAAIILILLAADLIALFLLTRRRLPPTACAVWALVILLFPALGVTTFLFGTQSDRPKDSSK